MRYTKVVLNLSSRMVDDLEFLAKQKFWKKEKWIIMKLEESIAKALFEDFVYANRLFITGKIDKKAYRRRTGRILPVNVIQAKKVYDRIGKDHITVTNRKWRKIPNLYW